MRSSQNTNDSITPLILRIAVSRLQLSCHWNATFCTNNWRPRHRELRLSLVLRNGIISSAWAILFTATYFYDSIPLQWGRPHSSSLIRKRKGTSNQSPRRPHAQEDFVIRVTPTPSMSLSACMHTDCIRTSTSRCQGTHSLHMPHSRVW